MNKEKRLYTVLNMVNISDTITDLANKIYMTQPYVSKIISRAEKEYGILLVDRTVKPLRLTRAGEVLRNYLYDLIELHNDMEYSLSSYKKNNTREIKIVINQPWLTTKVNELIKELINKFPDITFSFYTRTSNVAQQSLLDHKFDIFIGKYLSNKEIDSTYFTQTALYLIVPNNCSLANVEGNTLKMKDLKYLNGSNFISLTDDSFFQAMIDNLLHENEVRVNKIVKVESSVTAIQLALDGYGYTIGLSNIAQKIVYLNHKNAKLLRIPDNMLQLNEGVSVLSSCHPLVKDIKGTILEYFNKYPLIN